jgi:hypothetical protein
VADKGMRRTWRLLLSTLDSRPGGEQFLIGEIDQIHKMDRVSEVTSIAAFAVTERMTGLRYGLLVVPVQANVGGL